MDRRKLPDPQRLLRARERDRRQRCCDGKLVRVQELHSLRRSAGAAFQLRRRFNPWSSCSSWRGRDSLKREARSWRNRSDHARRRTRNWIKKIRRHRRGQNGDRLQRGHQSWLGDRPRLHDLSGGKFSRRPAARQHGQAATGTASDGETLTSRSTIKSKWPNADGGGFEPPETLRVTACKAYT